MEHQPLDYGTSSSGFFQTPPPSSTRPCFGSLLDVQNYPSEFIDSSQMTPPLTPRTAAEQQTQASMLQEQQQQHHHHHQQPTPFNFHNYLRAFYPFHPTSTVSSNEEESSITVPINQGDVILVHSIQPNGWADGTLLTSGLRGWLPTNYCENYDFDEMRTLLNALTYTWEFIRGHETEDPAAFAKQDYVRSMIAGVRIFLEKTTCLTRDATLVKNHVGIRRLRKGLLGDLSAFVKAGKHLRETCHDPRTQEEIYEVLDDIVLRAFKVITRAVRFLDIWQQETDLSRYTFEISEDGVRRTDIPLTPPAEAGLLEHEAAVGAGQGAGEGDKDAGNFQQAADLSDAQPHASQPNGAPQNQDSDDTSCHTSTTGNSSPVDMHPPSLHDVSSSASSSTTSTAIPDSANFSQTSQSERPLSALPPRTHSSLYLNLRSSSFSPPPPLQPSLSAESVPLDQRRTSRLSACTSPGPLTSSSINSINTISTTTTFSPDSPWAPTRPLSIQQKHTSASHRWSYSVKSPTLRKQYLVSERLSAAHDAFLGHIGAFIGLHLQSRSSDEVINTTENSVASCQTLLAVVEEVWRRDSCRSDSLYQAKENMQAKLAGLTEATRDIFRPREDCDECESVFLPGQEKPLVENATLCVRAAGDCNAKTRSVIERIGDFEWEPVGLGITSASSLVGNEQPDLSKPLPELTRENGGFEIVDKPLPSPPLPSPPAVNIDQIEIPPEPCSPPPPPPPGQQDALNTTTATLLPAPVLLHATTTSRASFETVVPQDQRPGSMASLTIPHRYPSLEVDIPSSPMDFSHMEDKSGANTKQVSRINSDGPSLAESGETANSFHNSEAGNGSDASTRATTPDGSQSKDDEDGAQLKASYSSLSLSESRSNLQDLNDNFESQLLTKTYAHELIFNKDGQISGGSLPALVERLTTHDSTPDAMFVNTFYLTFRLFTTPAEFAQILVDRFDYIADAGSIATPVRLRVYNVFKGWLETHWRSDCDADALPVITTFAKEKLSLALPSAGRRILELVMKVSESHGNTLVPRLVSSMGKTSTSISTSTTAEAPIPDTKVSRTQLNLLRKDLKNGLSSASILDFDAMELARQFTLIESKIFCSIQPEELLALEWTKKNTARAPNVKAMSTLSTDLTNLVADTILQLEEPKKRSLVIKQWVKIGKRCLELHNYDSLMAIVCGLNSSMVLRLRKTWDLLSPKTMARFEQLKGIVDVSRNYMVLRQCLQGQVAPCLPFVGIYLTDLTFVDVGNQTLRQLPRGSCSSSTLQASSRNNSVSGGIMDPHAPGSQDDYVSVINFDKHMRTAKIIGELQRFQIPYRLNPVVEMQQWMQAQIHRVRTSETANVQHYYRRSLMLEPREDAPKVPSRISPEMSSANASFSSVTSTGSSTTAGNEKPSGGKSEFWSNWNFPMTMGFKEKVST